MYLQEVFPHLTLNCGEIDVEIYVDSRYSVLHRYFKPSGNCQSEYPHCVCGLLDPFCAHDKQTLVTVCAVCGSDLVRGGRARVGGGAGAEQLRGGPRLVAAVRTVPLSHAKCGVILSISISLSSDGVMWVSFYIYMTLSKCLYKDQSVATST